MNLTSNPIVNLTTGLVRGTVRQSARVARAVAGEAAGIVLQARHMRSEPKPDMDDVTLARKVETELFRPRGAPKGSVDINVVEGVVYLRGEVKRPDQIKDLEARAREIPEVRGVENLLHLPKTPSPTRADSPRRAQKSPRSPRPAPRKRTSATRVRTTAEAPARTTAETPARTTAEAPARATAERPSGAEPSEETTLRAVASESAAASGPPEPATPALPPASKES